MTQNQPPSSLYIFSPGSDFVSSYFHHSDIFPTGFSDSALPPHPMCLLPARHSFQTQCFPHVSVPLTGLGWPFSLLPGALCPALYSGLISQNQSPPPDLHPISSSASLAHLVSFTCFFLPSLNRFLNHIQMSRSNSNLTPMEVVL